MTAILNIVKYLRIAKCILENIELDYCFNITVYLKSIKLRKKNRN